MCWSILYKCKIWIIENCTNDKLRYFEKIYYSSWPAQMIDRRRTPLRLKKKKIKWFWIPSMFWMLLFTPSIPSVSIICVLMKSTSKGIRKILGSDCVTYDWMSDGYFCSPYSVTHSKYSLYCFLFRDLENIITDHSLVLREWSLETS